MRVTNQEYNKLHTYFQVKEDHACRSFITIARYLGIRPAELNKIDIVESNRKFMTIKIIGAKKTQLGDEDQSKQRGIDSELTVPYSEELVKAIEYGQSLGDDQVDLMRKRFSAASIRVFPNAKKSFTCYSLRRTLGSYYKTKFQKMHPHDKPMARLLLSAIFGHKNTSSTGSYGTRGKNSSKLVSNVGFLIEPSLETIEQINDDMKPRFEKFNSDFKIDGKAVSESADNEAVSHVRDIRRKEAKQKMAKITDRSNDI